MIDIVNPLEQNILAAWKNMIYNNGPPMPFIRTSPTKEKYFAKYPPLFITI